MSKILDKEIDRPKETLVKLIFQSSFLKNDIIINVRSVLYGDSTFVYRVKTLKKIYYARFNKNNESFNAEILIHSILLKHNIKVPLILFYEEKNKETGLSFMIQEKLSGKSLEENYPSDNDLKIILFEAGVQLAKINQIDTINGFGILDSQSNEKLNGIENTFEDYFTNSFEKSLEILDVYPFSSNEKMHIIKLIKKARNILFVKRPILAYGDLLLEHIFHKNVEFAGFIDFGKVCGNSRLYDLGYITGFYQNRKLLSYLLLGYKTVASISDDDLYLIEYFALCIILKMLGIRANSNRMSYWYNIMLKQLEAKYE